MATYRRYQVLGAGGVTRGGQIVGPDDPQPYVVLSDEEAAAIPAGVLSAPIETVAGTSPRQVFGGQAFDSSGRLASFAAGGAVIGLGYDSAGRLASINTPDRVVTLGYTAGGDIEGVYVG